MAQARLSVRKIREILRLRWEVGYSRRQIAEILLGLHVLGQLRGQRFQLLLVHCCFHRLAPVYKVCANGQLHKFIYRLANSTPPAPIY